MEAMGYARQCTVAIGVSLIVAASMTTSSLVFDEASCTNVIR